jgi:uncharacterized protein (DUF3084 family)
LFFLRWIKWSGIPYLVFVFLFYCLDAFKVYRVSKNIPDSIAWIFSFPGLRKQFTDFLVSFSAGWWLATTVLFIFVVFLFDDVDELNSLKGKIQEARNEIGSLTTEIERLREEIQRLEEEKRILKSDVNSLEYQKKLVARKLEELKEERRNLSTYIKEVLDEAYKEGRERGYRSVIDELRSLRIQKSIVLDLFDNYKELRDLLKKLTGKTIRQYLRDEKKRRLKLQGLDGNDEPRD